MSWSRICFGFVIPTLFANGVGQAAPRETCARSFAALFFEKQSGHFYVAMQSWKTTEWYQKGLAKSYQARLVGAPKKVETVSFPNIKFIHPIDPKFGNGRTWGQTVARAKIIRDYLRHHPDFRNITLDFQHRSELSKLLNEAAESQSDICNGFRMPNGDVVLIDGNGRLAAWKIAIAEFAKEAGIEAPLFTMDINVVDYKDAPLGTAELIHTARRARGGENWDPRYPDAVDNSTPTELSLSGKRVPLTLDNAVRAYYDALADLIDSQERGKYVPPQTDAWRVLENIPTSGTDTRRVQEGEYRVPNDMLIFGLNSKGMPMRIATDGRTSEGETALLTPQDLVSEKYLFVVDTEGNLRIAAQNAPGEFRERKHGDMSPAALRPDVGRAVEIEAKRLQELAIETGQTLTTDEAFQNALINTIFHTPPDKAKYERVLSEAEAEIRASVSKRGLSLPDSLIHRKARIRALSHLQLLKEPLEKIYIPSTSGPVRGLAKIGGGFRVSKATDGSGDIVLHLDLSSSYSFARLDGAYLDTAQYLEGVASSLKKILSKNIRIEFGVNQ